MRAGGPGWKRRLLHRRGSRASPGYARLRRLVHERTGLDLEAYKERFIERRVAIRVRATRHEKLGDYLRYLSRSVARWSGSCAA